jgi:alanine racemase
VARPIQASVSLSALRHNYGIARRAAPGSKVFAVVKANAYGHGIERVARALPAADGFATLELDGAMALRERSPGTPVLLLEGFFEPSELKAIAAAGLSTVVHCEEQLRMLETGHLAQALNVWLKLNTGMNRLGFAPAAAPRLLERLASSGAAAQVTLMTHFATSDGPEGVAEAMCRFDSATQGLEGLRSLANSAAIFAHPGSHRDIVRLGIGLYGATPFAEKSAAALGLQAAMTLATRIIAVQELKPGDTVGYGGGFRAKRAMRIGVVACGYADGYPRHAHAGTPVLVEGVRVRIAGRVSMDMITVDLGPVPQAGVGSPVILWGEGLPVDEVAMESGTVGYELLCAVAPRVPFVETDAT